MGLRIIDVLKEASTFECLDCKKHPNCNRLRRQTFQRVLHRLSEMAAQNESDTDELSALMQDINDHRICSATMRIAA
jgi:NADH:ubiquinone oxidoreductase subunit F (NADH-binding)